MKHKLMIGKMRNLYLLILVFYSIESGAQSVKSLMKSGNKEYKAQNFAEAQASYNKANQAGPTFNGEYNEANALYHQNKFTESAELNMSALGKAKTNEEKAMASYNLGNSFFKANEMEKAIDAYKQSLRLNPKDLDAKKNLTKALQKKKQQEQQQKQDQKDQSKKDNKPSDQQKQDQKGEGKNNEGEGQQAPQQNDPKANKPEQGKPQNLTKQEAENLLKIMKQEEQAARAKILKRQRPEEGGRGKDW